MDQEQLKATIKLFKVLSTREAMAESFKGSPDELSLVQEVLTLSCKLVNKSAENMIEKAITQKNDYDKIHDSDLSKNAMIFVRLLCQEMMVHYGD